MGCLAGALVLAAGCSKKQTTGQPANPTPAQPVVSYYHVDPSTAGTVSGEIRYTGRKPAAKVIDMSEDPACVATHKGVKVHDESLVVGKKDGLADAFVYISKGLEGKNFEVPSTPVTIDQRGCWFHPRVMGIQVGQELQILNSDPVTHNIHPMAEVNREWNHSMGPGDPPIHRKFTKVEVMIPVKCNIHSWMHAFIGAVDNPYFAVTKDDGSFTIPNLPPGTYTLSVWHDGMKTQDQQITVPASGKAEANFTFKDMETKKS